MVKQSVKEKVDSLLESYSLQEGTFVDDSFNIFISRDINDIVDELNATGITIDEDRLDAHIAEYEKKQKEAIANFNSAVTKAGYTVNMNKRKEVLDLFYNKLQLPVYKETKTGPSLDKETLEFLSEYSDIPKYYEEANSARSMLNTLNNIKAALDQGKIYPHHNLNKAASGRFSSGGTGNKININGWSKDIRDILKPAESYIIVSFDYKNMEGAVSACMAKQTDLIEDMDNDVDLHQQLADILGVDRKVAKVVNHGCNYGMTAFGLARRLRISEEEAQEFIDKYWAKRDKIKNLKDDVIQTARMMGIISTISGFTRDVDYRISDNQIWSTFIQGSAADLFKQALVNVQQYLKKTDAGRVSTIMHDALVCELKADENLDKTIDDIKNIMETVHPEFKLHVDISRDKW